MYQSNPWPILKRSFSCTAIQTWVVLHVGKQFAQKECPNVHAHRVRKRRAACCTGRALAARAESALVRSSAYGKKNAAWRRSSTGGSTRLLLSSAKRPSSI